MPAVMERYNLFSHEIPAPIARPILYRISSRLLLPPSLTLAGNIQLSPLNRVGFPCTNLAFSLRLPDCPGLLGGDLPGLVFSSPLLTLRVGYAGKSKRFLYLQLVLIFYSMLKCGLQQGASLPP